MTALEEMISPATAVARLAAVGIHISERALRERAREIGAYRQIGRAIFFTPGDLEKIMAPVAASPSRQVKKSRIAPRKERSIAVGLEEARARLKQLKLDRR